MLGWSEREVNKKERSGMIAKFGLTEFERYISEVGFKKGDVRTIRGILAIVGVPNKIVQEAQTCISVCKETIGKLGAEAVEVKDIDARDEANTQVEINVLKEDRKLRRGDNNNIISAAKAHTNFQNSDVKRLENILKKFS